MARFRSAFAAPGGFVAAMQVARVTEGGSIVRPQECPQAATVSTNKRVLRSMRPQRSGSAVA